MTKREIAALVADNQALVTILVDALRWLDENEPKWKLDRSTNKRAFIIDLADKIEIANEP